MLCSVVGCELACAVLRWRSRCSVIGRVLGADQGLAVVDFNSLLNGSGLVGCYVHIPVI
jgi:hypothetical protein